jgi:hypothetical protein
MAPHTPPPVAGALGAPVRTSSPHAESVPAPDATAAPRSPVDPATMHRAEDDAAAHARSRDFADDVPRPEHED